MSGIVMEITPAEHTDHPKCLRCNRSLKDPKWRGLGYGKKCYAKHCQECQQTLGEPEEKDATFPEQRLETEGARQDRAPDPSIKKRDKRTALDQAIKEEMAKKNPEPTEAQRKAAEARLLNDVDKAIGAGEETEEPAEEPKKANKKKAPKGRAVVKPGAFNRKGRSVTVNARDN